MDCPFCGKEMEEGEIFLPLHGSAIANYNGEVMWSGKSKNESSIRLGGKPAGFSRYYKANKCNECRKLIMDIVLPEDTEIDKMTCPNCGASIDADYPKCPECKYDFYEGSDDKYDE